VTSDGSNYCFLSCTTKADCNYNRAASVEANCSSDITLVEPGGGKACVPPSSN
jgi:hypothetical protein